jgi:hypothetical protein
MVAIVWAFTSPAANGKMPKLNRYRTLKPPKTFAINAQLPLGPVPDLRSWIT